MDWPTAREVFLPSLVGLAAGAALAGLQQHPRRALGMAPFGATIVAVASAALAGGLDQRWFLGLAAFAAAWLVLPLRNVLRRSHAAGAAGVVPAVAGAIMLTCAAWLALPPHALALMTGLGALLAWGWLYREALELVLEVLLWPVYRIRADGPGKREFPLYGPVLVVSNHTAWLDPLWLGKVIPRRLIPLMGSGFYDLPVMRWLMVNLVGAIRVQETHFRREAPELDQAVQALDRGECVVIFPEGRVRRTQEEPLRQFGRGVWHILQRRPQTTVVVCWIEGGWGSYFSYWNGRPMTGKPLDWWRPIRIGMGRPAVLDPAILADHRATRSFLRQACLEARCCLGLEPLVLLTKKVEETDDEP